MGLSDERTESPLLAFRAFVFAALNFCFQIFPEAFGDNARRGKLAQVGDGKFRKVREYGRRRRTGMADQGESNVVAARPLTMLGDGVHDVQ